MLRVYHHLLRLCIVAVLLAIFVARPAAADDTAVPGFAADCHAQTDRDRTVGQMLARAAWTCSNANWRSDAPAVWLRFESAGWEQDRLPAEFFSRTARFESVTFYAIDTDGTVRTRHLKDSAGTPVPVGPVFTMPLPQITRDTALLLVQIKAPHSIPLLTEARISHDHTRTQFPRVNLLVLALVMGSLILPLLFDISFFLVLRERFVVVHAAMVSALMVYVLTAGGLITAVVTLPMAVMAVLAPLSYAIGSGLSGLFLVNFLECGAQSHLMRRITIYGGWFTMIVPGFMALQLDATQPFDDWGYFVTFLPFIGIITAALLEALIRGSRSARFLAAAWAPIIIASVERLLRGLGWHVAPQSFDHLLHIAVGIEVVVISLAIADRFFALRNERDAALTEARKLEQLSTRDSLTGLINRRGIEARFEELVAQGFHTFALIDLDRFKAVNDLHGHQKGDAALVACADAIRGSGDRDTIAVRLGGEEFVVLLRGPRSLERAEALRQAIPMRIAQAVPGLDLPVTASMGLIVIADADQHQMAFSAFYARADALMYEAKASGRNRLAYERLTVFSPPPKAGRRQNKAA